MLDFLRKRKRSWIITFLLGVIIVVFIAFYGGSNYQSQGAPDVAEVNGDAISQREFSLQYQKTLERYRELLKGSLTPEMLKSLNLKNTLLEELIQKRLLRQEAQELGLTASDDELMDAIGQVREFQVAGRFNKERYLQLLRANRLTPGEFEEEQREQLTIQRLYGVILDSTRITDAEMRERYRFEQEKINLQYVRFSVSDAIPEVKLSEDDIKKFYDGNKEMLKEPLKLQVEYLSYPFDRFAAGAQVSEKEIEDYYQANRDSKFRKPKELKLRYVSIRVPPGADAKQQEDARARADRVVAEARGGKDFAQLAKQFSDDASAAKGGDLGWATQGQLPPQLANVFGMAKGQVSDVIETTGRFQVVKVEDSREEKTATLKDLTSEITRSLKTEKGKREAAKVADRDREKMLSGNDLAKIAQESGVAVNVTPWFSSGQVLPEIGQNQEFYKNAFALGPKDVSPVVEGNSAYYLLKIKERKEPAVPPIETVRPNIEKGLKESKAYEIVLQKANGLLDQLKKERDLAKLAAQNGLKVEETGWFLRTAPQLPKIGELPEMRSGVTLSAEKPIADKVFTQKDVVYILAFKGSQGADMERFESEKEALTKQALAETRQQVLQKFIEGLKSKAKIQIHAGALEQD
ncbi:MAG TPA: SurA N-terminal domain-containing protein [Candidatus Binatia bacterium]|nr:SurA N-terminal domain-containing protein [Candidatus Binatia bacterium]